MQNTIKIDNRDAESIHIDTYGMLTGESATDSELEYINTEEREPNTPELTYDDFDWTYNHPQIVKDFAHESINIITQALAGTEYADIILNIEYISSESPCYYNYTTDHYIAAYTVDTDKLAAYTEKHNSAITEIAKTYGTSWEEPTFENLQHAAICHILNNAITADDYNMSMWERETEIYCENTKRELITKT